jgi:phospholipid/cholesterol/gamma-HCH transport system permease protein
MYAFCDRLGLSFRFIMRVLASYPSRRVHVKQILEQIYRLGNETVLIILVAGSFIGMVITLQGFTNLAKYGAESEISGLTAYSIYRELAPVLTGILVAGRVGSLLAAEIGMMQINQQFMCLEMLGINANRLILFPRLLAVIVSMPILNTLFCLSAIMSSNVVCTVGLGLPEGMFWNSLQYQTLFMLDFMHGLKKSFVFGIIVAWIALFQGMYTSKDRLGLAHATTTTVVSASLFVLAIDYVITAISGGVMV